MHLQSDPSLVNIPALVMKIVTNDFHSAHTQTRMQLM